MLWTLIVHDDLIVRPPATGKSGFLDQKVRDVVFLLLFFAGRARNPKFGETERRESRAKTHNGIQP